MSGLEALAVACNIIELISFCHETVGVCKEIYKGQIPDAALGEQAKSLQGLSTELQTHYQAASTQTSNERELANIASKCSIAARALDEEVQFLQGHHVKGSLRSTLSIAVKTKWRKARLERLEKSLQSCQTTMESHLLAKVCKQSDAIQLQQRQSFEQLHDNLQHFIAQYAAGHDKIVDLAKSNTQIINNHATKQTSEIRDHVTAEAYSTHNMIASHVAAEIKNGTDEISRNMQGLLIQRASDKQRERLLQSLKFPAMNERINAVADSFGDTFKWILRVEEDGKDEDEYCDGDKDYGSNYDDNDNESMKTGGNASDYDDQTDLQEGNLGTIVQEDNAMSTDDEYEGGGHWLSRSPQDATWDNFRDWLKSESDLYWINGKPGSGKSALMKYIIAQPQTTEALQSWKSNAIILSHFFWKPGTMLQKNIKGLLCDILYQLFSQQSTIIDRVLSTFKFSASKDSDTDWSLKELQLVLMDTLALQRPYCIFIDGLDEICIEDGPIALMNIVDSLKALPNVKVCVASRPDSQLLHRLCNCQQLKLQDLTREDMYKYTKEMMLPVLHAHQLSQTSVISELIHKAEGVFLWLHLAIRSLIRGIEQGDSEYELSLRLKALPSELSKLYLDMWAKLNEDTLTYRESAARYFNLMISFKSDISYREIDNKYSSYRWIHDPPISLFRLMASTESSIQRAFLRDETIISQHDLERMLDKTRKMILSRCAGLVEILPAKYRSTQPQPKIGRTKILESMDWSVDFIHRTAYDFLYDTEEGYKIRAYDQACPDDLNFTLIKAILVEAGIPGAFHSVFSVLHQLSSIRGITAQDRTELLHSCWKWYDSDRLRFDARPKALQSPHFLAIAAPFVPADFVLSNIAIEPDPSATASEVLRDIWYIVSQYSPDALLAVCRLATRLLSQYPKANTKGVSHYEHHDNIQAKLLRKICSPFSNFLQIYGLSEWLTKDVEILFSAFMDIDPDPSERLAIIVSFDSFRYIRVFISCLDSSDDIPADLSEPELDHLRVIHLVLTGSVASVTDAIYRNRVKTRMVTEGTDDCQVNDILDIVISEDEVSPMLTAEYIIIRSSDDEEATGKRYRIMNTKIRIQNLDMFERWLCYNRSELLEEDICTYLTNIAQAALDGSNDYEELNVPIGMLLAEKGCGYCVEN